MSACTADLLIMSMRVWFDLVGGLKCHSLPYAFFG